MSMDQTENEVEPRRRGGPFRFFGEVRELSPIEVEDDLDANLLTTTERYELGRAWSKVPDTNDVEFAPIDDLFSQHLTTEPVGRRSWPIDLGLPRRASWTTDIVLPMGVTVNGWDRAYEMPGVRVTSRHTKLDGEGREIRLERREAHAQTLPLGRVAGGRRRQARHQVVVLAGILVALDMLRPHPVDRPVAGDRGEPRQRLPGFRRKTLRVLPDAHEGVLDHILRNRPVAGDTQHNSE